MGGFECSSISCSRISLEELGKLLQKTINIKEISEQVKPFSFRYNLIEEYNKIKLRANKNNTENFSYSKKYKYISDFRPLELEKEIFIKWVKILYDFQNLKEFQEIKIQKFQNDNFFLKNLEKAFNTRKKQFLKLVTLGVPSNLRQFIWTIIIDNDEKEISNISNYEKEKEYFQTLLSLNIENKKDIEQIEKDIIRTFIAEENTQKNILKLKHILIALNNLYPKIGYCQGINFIVALILKITKFNEIKTFHLSRLIFKRIKDYFTKDFPLLKYNLSKFNEVFIKLFPKLYYHLKNNDIVNEIWVGKWIQTLFTVNLPFNEACHIWDSLLVYGLDFIIPIILSILSFIKDKLLKLNDSSDIMILFQETLTPSEENLIDIIYKEGINLKNYIIPVIEIISNAKKIRNHYNLGPHDGNEYTKRNKIDIRKSLENSFNSTNNFENKMKIIKSQKLIEDEIVENNYYNNLRKNNFKNAHHKNIKTEQKINSIYENRNDLKTIKNRCHSQKFSYLNRNNINFNRLNRSKYMCNNHHNIVNRTHSSFNYFKNYFYRNNKFPNRKGKKYLNDNYIIPNINNVSIININININTPEINRNKLREKIYSQINIRRTNFNQDFLFNNVNEFIEGEKYKNEIPTFSNIKIFKSNFS